MPEAASDLPLTVSDYSRCKGKQIAATGGFYTRSLTHAELFVDQLIVATLLTPQSLELRPKNLDGPRLSSSKVPHLGQMQNAHLKWAFAASEDR